MQTQGLQQEKKRKFIKWSGILVVSVYICFRKGDKLISVYLHRKDMISKVIVFKILNFPSRCMHYTLKTGISALILEDSNPCYFSISKSIIWNAYFIHSSSGQWSHYLYHPIPHKHFRFPSIILWSNISDIKILPHSL